MANTCSAYVLNLRSGIVQVVYQCLRVHHYTGFRCSTCSQVNGEQLFSDDAYCAYAMVDFIRPN